MSEFSELLRLAERIPAAFWGVVIGSFFALGGVVLTNRAHDRRLRHQLAYDRELRNRDRELSLRRDIYLAASEAVSAGLIALGRFGNLEISNDRVVEGYLDKAPSIAKVHVIAREETVRVVLEFVGELTRAYTRLFAKRVSLMTQKAHLDIAQDNIQRSSTEQGKILELMKQYNVDGQHDPKRWGVLESNFDFEKRRLTETAEQHAAIARALYSEQIDYVKGCIEQVSRLQRLSVPVLLAVRAELDLPINQTEYQNATEEAIRKQEATINEFVLSLQTALEKIPISRDTARPHQ